MVLLGFIPTSDFMARRASNVKKIKRVKPISKINRQLIGFILLLLIFAMLCYVTFIMYSEGTLFNNLYPQYSPTEGSNNTGMTTVSIVYKNSSKV